jgi:hypothetical protein
MVKLKIEILLEVQICVPDVYSFVVTYRCKAYQVLFGWSNKEAGWAEHVARMGERRGA